MTETYRLLLATLLRHLSPVNANSLLGRALRECNVSIERVSPRDVTRIMPKLETGIRLFLDGNAQKALWAELAALAPPVVARREVVQVRSEQDVSTARLLAKAICDNLGARSVMTQKVATLVSELARNIVKYTQGGTIELDADASLPGRIRVRARDRGPGISNVDEVLSGTYRSRTGLGRGLLGVKRLSDRFEIETGPAGTTVEAEVQL